MSRDNWISSRNGVRKISFNFHYDPYFFLMCLFLHCFPFSLKMRIYEQVRRNMSRDTWISSRHRVHKISFNFHDANWESDIRLSELCYIIYYILCAINCEYMRYYYVYYEHAYHDWIMYHRTIKYFMLYPKNIKNG